MVGSSCVYQHASQCLAHDRGCAVVFGPRVLPTAACTLTEASTPATAPPFSWHRGAAIALVLGFNRSYVQPRWGSNPRRSYYDSTELVVRCVLSLQRVNTSLPVHLLVSGERDEHREAVIAALGVTIDPVPATLRVPTWSSPYMRGTFYKLATLALVRGGATLSPLSEQHMR